MTTNIVVVCQHGASTGMLVEKMIEAAEKQKRDVVINAYSESMLADVIKDADIVLILSVRFKAEFETRFADRGILSWSSI